MSHEPEILCNGIYLLMRFALYSRSNFVRVLLDPCASITNDASVEARESVCVCHCEVIIPLNLA